MYENEFFVDIHCHPTLRAYNAPASDGGRSLWKKAYNPVFETAASRWARMNTQDTSKESQADFPTVLKGKTRVLFDSLYPVEKGFLNFRKIASMVFGQENADQVLQTATGIDTSQMRRLRQSNDYFQELLSQYAFLVQGQGPSPDGTAAYKVVADFDELSQVLQNEPTNTLAVVVTIEGAHAFNCGLQDRGRIANQEELSKNIGISKSWKNPPFFVNLSHHFYNELCGLPRSLKPLVGAVMNQKEGRNQGISSIGWHVIHEMLAQDNGRRILIDTKHMSIKARKEYYQFLQSYNRLNPKDKIPIICSHTGINGFETMSDSVKNKDKPKKMRNTHFHNWSINLSNEEIRIIHQSEGLIGVMMDKTLLSSTSVLESIKKMEDPIESKNAFVQMVADNIFGMVAAIGQKSAWDIIALGTDYDGMISHLDPYPDMAHLPNLKTDLIEFLRTNDYQQNLWFGYEPEELVMKILRDNSMNFLRRHFVSKPSQQIFQSRNALLIPST